MKAKNITTSMLVSQSPEPVFAAINRPGGWWSKQIDGNTDRLNEELTFFRLRCIDR